MDHHVDIYHEPGIRFRPGPVLELAERNGVRGTVELLLPYTVSGPGYSRGVFESLRTALRMLKDNRIDEGIHWLGEAVNCVPVRSRTLHRPSQPHPGQPSPAPSDSAGTTDQEPGTRSPGSVSDAAGTPAPDHHQASPVGHAPAGAAPPAVEVHVYPAEVARAMARTTAAATYTQPGPDAAFHSIHLVGTATGPEAGWREMLKTGAATGALTAIAVSDPRQVWPENRLNDQRWRQVAHQVAAAVDPHAPWVAFRTRPDAVVLFTATSPAAGPVAQPHPAAAAIAALRQEQRPRARPPVAGAAAPSPRRAATAGRPADVPSPGRTSRPITPKAPGSSRRTFWADLAGSSDPSGSMVSVRLVPRPV